MLKKIENNLLVPTPVSAIEDMMYEDHGCQVFIKRDDLIHPFICGNKWRKLKYNLIEAIENRCTGILSFGGAYSNHLVAVAASCHYLGMTSKGFIRSHKEDISNPTLDKLGDLGMEISFLTPPDYRDYQLELEIKNTQIGGDFLIPEGGTNRNALKGIAELVDELEINKNDYTHIVTAVGTGGTICGIIKKLDGRDIRIIGISPFKGNVNKLKGFQYLNDEELEKIEVIRSVPESKFGSYNENIVQYIRHFKRTYNIMLDPIYTSKVMMTLNHLIKSRKFEEGSKILVLHTGGLQGIKGFEFQYNCKIFL